MRQDQGVDPSVEAPDWKLIDKLHEIAEKDDIEVPDVPEAPDLDAVVREEEPLPETDLEPEQEEAEPAPEQPAVEPTPPVDDGVVTWGLAEGEDLWAGTSWEEE